jgi:hypothetical protein
MQATHCSKSEEEGRSIGLIRSITSYTGPSFFYSLRTAPNQKKKGAPLGKFLLATQAFCSMAKKKKGAPLGKFLLATQAFCSMAKKPL